MAHAVATMNRESFVGMWRSMDTAASGKLDTKQLLKGMKLVHDYTQLLY